MADFTILRSDGWRELNDVEASIANGDLDIERLWSLVAQGEWEEATEELAAAGYESQLWPHGYSSLPLHLVNIVQTPDDIRGAHTQIWVNMVEVEE